MATADVAAVQSQGVHADRVDGGARDPRAAAAARHAVVHHVPAQQRDPLDRRVDHQRSAHGKRRGDAAQFPGRVYVAVPERAGRSTRSTTRKPTPIARTSAPVIQQFEAKEAGKSAKVTTTPAQDRGLLHRARPRVEAGHSRRPSSADRHRTERRWQRGPPAAHHRRRRAAPADPTKPRGLRMCDPDPALARVDAPRPESLLR